MLNKTTFSMLLILTASLIIYYASLVIVSNTLNFISLFFLMLFGVSWLYSIKEVWILFIYLFGFLFAALSGFFVELFNLYMFEIVEWGKLSGASALTTALMVLFLAGACVSCRALFRGNWSVARFKYADDLCLKILIVVAFVLPLYLLGVIYFYGSPLFMGVDRFTYWSEVAPPGVSKVRYFLVFMSFVLGYAQFSGKLNRVLVLLWLFISLLALVLNGEKLSGFIVLLYFYIIPYFAMGAHNFSARKFLLVLGGLGGALLFVVVFNYFLIQGDVDSTLSLFMARLAVQGQMNYAIVNSSSGGAFSEIWNAFIGIGSDEYNKGIYYLMYLVAPEGIVERRITQGTTFTIPFPANNIYFFGWHLSILITAITAVLVGLVSGVVLVALRSQNFILAFVAMALFYYLYGAVLMGNMNKIFEWKFLLMVFVVGAFLLVGFRTPKKFATKV